jgi:hypothetical protein
VLGPLFRTAGHTVRTQHGITASAGQRRCYGELSNYLQACDSAGCWSLGLVFDLSMTHDHFGISYRQHNTDKQNISLLPSLSALCTSTRMHGEFLHLLFLQAHRETETHFTAPGM